MKNAITELEWVKVSFPQEDFTKYKNIKEFATICQFFETDPDTLGWNGSGWDFDAVIVEGLAVVDKDGPVSQFGKHLWKKYRLSYCGGS